MAVTTVPSVLQFSGVVANTPIAVAMQTYNEEHVTVFYGNMQVQATQDLDYTVVLNGGAEFVNFTLTPLTSLLTKIAALIAANPTTEVNILTVRRTLPLTNDFVDTDAFIRDKIVNEIDMLLMRMQQLTDNFNVITNLENADAFIAAAFATRDVLLTGYLVAKVGTATTITGGGLITGGGDLSANRVLTVTPSTNAQAVAGADTLTSMTPAATQAAIAGQVSVGMCFLIAATVIPSGMRAVKRNGALLSRVTYAALWAFANASGNIVSDATWLAGAFGAFSFGDGATTFRLMDDRGYFDRAYDDGRGIDSGRVMTAPQADSLKDHTHPYNAPDNSAFNYANAGSQGSVVSGKTTGSPSTGAAAETRPKNNAKLAVIGY